MLWRALCFEQANEREESYYNIIDLCHPPQNNAVFLPAEVGFTILRVPYTSSPIPCFSGTSKTLLESLRIPPGGRATFQNSKLIFFSGPFTERHGNSAKHFCFEINTIHAEIFKTPAMKCLECFSYEHLRPLPTYVTLCKCQRCGHCVVVRHPFPPHSLHLQTPCYESIVFKANALSTRQILAVEIFEQKKDKSKRPPYRPHKEVNRNALLNTKNVQFFNAKQKMARGAITTNLGHGRCSACLFQSNKQIDIMLKKHRYKKQVPLAVKPTYSANLAQKQTLPSTFAGTMPLASI